MPTLAFNVEADYQKVIRLREEVERLEKALNGMEGNGSEEAIAQLESQLASAREEMKKAATSAADLGASIEQSVGKMQFSSVEEEMNALSMAIHENEKAMAESIAQIEKWKREGQEAFNAGNMGTLEAITADINDQVAKYKELQTQTEQYKRALQGLADGTVDSSLQGIANSITGLDQACDANRAEIERLTAEYNKLNAQYERGVAEGSKEEQAILSRMQTIRGEITVRRSLIREMQEQANALEVNQAKMSQEIAETNQTTQAHESLRSKMRQLKQEMAELRMQGIDEQSEAYRRLRDELGRLQDVQGDIQRQGSILANDERAIAGVQSGIQGLTGAFMGANAAVGLFGASNQNLQQILVKSHYLMAISNGLQQAAAMLNKDSAFRLVTLGKAQEWWNKLLAAGRGEQVANTIATTADTVAEEANTAARTQNTVATGANTTSTVANTGAEVAHTTATIGLAGAFRMLGAAIKSVPVWGWIVAGVGALVTAITLLNKRLKEQTQATEEAKKKAEEFYKSVADTAYKPIGAIEQLSSAWTKLGDNLEAKEKYIADNKSKFDALGLSIQDVYAAEDLLVKNKDRFIQAQIEKAKATVILNQATEGLKELVELDQQIADMTTRNKQMTTTGYVAGKGMTQVAKTAKDIENEDKELQELQAKRDEQNKKITAMFEQSNAYEQEANDAMEAIEGVVITAQRTSTNTLTKATTDTLASATAKYKELSAKYGKEEARQAIQTNFAVRQAEIDAMEEGNVKTLAQIDLDFEEQQTAIEQWYEDLLATRRQKAKELWENDPSNQGKTFDESSADVAYTEQETELYNAQLEANERKRKESIEAIVKAETQSMRDFLKEYGTYQEQRQVLAEEYAEKIAKAETQGEKMALTVQRDNDLQKLDVEYNDRTDWASIFARIDNYSTAYLTELRGKLENMLSDKNLTAEQAQALGDRLAAVNKALIDRAQTWFDVIGLNNERLKETRKLQEDLLNLQNQLNTANEEQERTLSDIEAIKEQICQLIEGKINIELTADNIELGDFNDIFSQLTASGESEENMGALSDLFNQWGLLSSKSNGLTQTIGGLNDKIGSTEDQLAGMSEGMEGFMSSLSMVEKVCKLINANVQSMNDLLDEMGLGDTSFARGWQSFAESSQYATQGIEDLKSGNFVGVAGDVMGSLRTLGDALGEWTGWGFFGSSDKSLSKDVERMTLANQELERAIQSLTNEISKNTTSLSEATEEYKTQIDNLNESMANTQEMMSRSGAASSSGFFGIGSQGSSNRKINKNMTDSEWARISDIVGRSITSAGDFWTLSSYEMWQVSTQATDLYAKIKQYADDGYKDAAQYMDAYIEYWQEMEELVDAYNQKLTATDFDSVVSNFQSAIMDMDHSAADFADDFENMMKNAVISSLMSSTYSKQLENWYNQFAEYMETGGELELWEQNQLKDEYDRIVSEAQNDINKLYETLGWSREGYSQSATTGGFTTMSEDTGQELNGRFTALQEAGYQILAIEQENYSLMAEVTDISRENRTLLAESYLELQSINDNTADTVAQLLIVAKYLKGVKENTDKL